MCFTIHRLNDDILGTSYNCIYLGIADVEVKFSSSFTIVGMSYFNPIILLGMVFTFWGIKILVIYVWGYWIESETQKYLRSGPDICMNDIRLSVYVYI